MSKYHIYGNSRLTKFQAWDLLAQDQIDFQKSIANRKVTRTNGWRMDNVRSGPRDSSRMGSLCPMVPGGHRWAHYCRPEELLAWRDHLWKESLEVEVPLRCGDLGLWQGILAKVPPKPVVVTTLASVEGIKLLAELSPGALEGEIDPNKSTIRNLEWQGKPTGSQSAVTSAQGRSAKGLASRPYPNVPSRINWDEACISEGSSSDSGYSGVTEAVELGLFTPAGSDVARARRVCGTSIRQTLELESLLQGLCISIDASAPDRQDEERHILALARMFDSLPLSHQGILQARVRSLRDPSSAR